MAKSYEELKNEISAITNEVEDGANTANRIGGAMDDIVDYTKDSLEAQEERINEETDIKISGLVVQETGDGEGVVMSQKAVSELISKYSSILTDITMTYLSEDDTFSFDGDFLSIKDNIYLYPLNKSRILISAIDGIELGLSSASSGTRFVAYDINNLMIRVINPSENFVGVTEEGVYVFAIAQKVPYRISNILSYKYEIHTKNNAHRSVDRGFQGTFTTASSTEKYGINNIKTPGVYIRNEGTGSGSRGGLLFVSETNEVIRQVHIEIGNNGKFAITERFYDNETETWTSFKNVDGISYLKLPAMTVNGNIVFENNKITFKSTPYVYTETSRYGLPTTGELTLTSGVTRLIWNRIEGIISDAAVNTYYDESDIVTLGFIVRDSKGNVKDSLFNIACQDIIYPTGNKLFSNIYNPSKIKYIPHRGVRNAEIPENTTYSVMFAALYGLKYAECDVRYTSDGVGIVMHDTTINRTMYNIDLSDIEIDVTIADNTYEVLSQYVYKSINPLYRTKLQTMKEYIDACAQWDICPIIQGSMSDEDLDYCMQRLGDNWICYGGNFAKVRNYSHNVLCLTSANYDTVDDMITALKNIGGKVGLSRLYNDQLTDEYISACKSNGFEVMASYAYQHQNIPDAIRRGATIILSDNVGKNTNKVLFSSINGWDALSHNGSVSEGQLLLGTSGWLNYRINKKGSYKIYAQFVGNGKIELPNYNDKGEFVEKQFPMDNGVFIYTLLYLEEGERIISIDTTEGMSLQRLIIFHEEN